jgi:hypothetical protein
MKSWRTSSALVLAASVATLISGCGGPKESPAAGNAPAKAEAAPAAKKEITLAKGWEIKDVLSAEEVGAITGETMAVVPRPDSKAAEGRPAAAYEVTGKMLSQINFSAVVAGGEKEFEGHKQWANAGSVQDVPGLGDKAYVCDVMTGAAAIVVLQGQDVVRVDWQPKPYEKFEKADLGRKLAGKLLEKMYK